MSRPNIYKVVWSNEHASDELPYEFVDMETAIKAGQDWKAEMVAIDDDPAQAAREYQWEVVRIDPPTSKESMTEDPGPLCPHCDTDDSFLIAQGKGHRWCRSCKKAFKPPPPGPDFTKHDPKGWCGDPSRGAALGRPEVIKVDPENFYGKVFLRKLRMSPCGAYDANGTYWGANIDGIGDMYWCTTQGNTVDFCVRAQDREDAKAKVREKLPEVRFYR